MTAPGAAASRHVLAAIDGTGSTEWRRPDGTNSHVFCFHRDFDVPRHQKRYFDGPALLGVEVGRIGDQVLNWILGVCGLEGPHVPQLRMRRIGLFTGRPELIVAPIEAHLDDAKSPQAGPGSDRPPFVVSLVGHSRGGLIAILVAKSLARYGVRVRFLGLYDAVDMELRHEGQRIENVDHTFHAARSPSMDSRSWWGNTGTESTGKYDTKTFMTSHGGIGGDPTLRPESIGDDFSCDTRGLTAGIMRALGGDMESMCRDNGRRADEWIRAGARQVGLPLT